MVAHLITVARETKDKNHNTISQLYTNLHRSNILDFTGAKGLKKLEIVIVHPCTGPAAKCPDAADGRGVTIPSPRNTGVTLPTHGDLTDSHTTKIVL
ncbi:hypothetical protein Pcinc_021580 [Petrolisthes cinctipes]|uniref:Uncharacterized protein n=1 Tax=Petrolisthes cinctipes TaxID=88211 RepID=A0AAE1FFA3_PETCI|nr:hypothetical protein Pcinc_021580 [Petrolisthes cinctipes]